MKLLLKIGKIFAVLILTVSIVLFSAAFLLKDKVGFIILKSFNKNLSTKVDVGSYRLSFLRNFPKASLELKNVLVHSSPGFNSSEFKGIDTDTLLSARSVSLEFRITDILKGIYTIQRIGARTGKANFFTDTTGHVNYNISVKNDHPGPEETIINLEKINLSDINAYYNNLEAHLILIGIVKSGRLKSRISGNNIDFTASSEIQIKRFQLYNFVINKPVPTKLDLILQSSKSGMKFKKGTLYIDNYDVGIDGFVSADNILDLNLTGHNLDISRIRKWLPEKNFRFLDDYDPSGIITVSSKIKGLLSRKSNPHIDIEWQLRNGRIASKKSNLPLKDLSFNGHYSNGTGNRSETSSLSIEGFKADLGSSECTGSAILKEFNDPMINLSLKGRVFPGEMKEFFNLKNISTAEGSVDFDLKVDNAKWPAKSFSFDRLIDLKPQGSLTFNSVTLGLQNNKTLIKKINGNLMITNSIKANKIKFNFKGQNVRVDGEFKNLAEWLAGRAVTMSAKADIAFDKLFPETFFKDDDVSGKNGRNQKGVTLPKGIVLDINFHIDSLYYKTFSSSKIEGSLSYQPKTFIFKSLKIKSLDGLISGNCFFAQNNNKSIISRGSFIVTNIDVNKAFTTFHNFGQSFLKAENIKGRLSGSLSLLLPLDSVLNYNIKSLTAEGNYHLVNGALINFAPVKQLSSFIELSELENISFQQLDNDFFIKNNWLYVPQMEVKSSAADLSVNGKHSFDNDYEYHVKIRLSEILSRKRNKNKSNVNEFGVVEDDGLGHTSLLLKIIGKGETAKVGYDLKAAGTEVKNNLKKEKNSLKTILNQEYGWYKSDSSLNQKPPVKKSRFRIKWDEEDTVKNAPDTSSVKNIFKKK